MDKFLKTNNLLILLVTLLLLLNVLLLNKLKGKNQYLNKANHTDTMRLQELHEQISILEIKDWLQLESSQKKIDPKLKLVTEQQDSICLKDLVGDQRKLVLRYSELNCNQCVDSVFRSLKTLVKEIGKEKVIILASYSRYRNLAIFKRLNQLKMDVYNVKEEALGLPLEKTSTPFMFLLDEDYQTKCVFVPEKTMLKLTDNYFYLIKNRLE